MWTQEMFGVEKPIIALLHLDALPGDPGFSGDLDSVVDHAGSDLDALQKGGVDGILFANESSKPYQSKPDIAMISAMAFVIGALRSSVKVPFGVNVVKNPLPTIDLAAATGASFARNSFSGAYMGEYGLLFSSSGEVIRRRKALGISQVKLLYKVNAESDVYLAERDIQIIAKSIMVGGFADALCVSGSAAGTVPDAELLAKVCRVAKPADVPVFCNTGCNHSNAVEKLAHADAACVGTAFKSSDGRVDINLVRSFMDIVRNLRAEL